MCFQIANKILISCWLGLLALSLASELCWASEGALEGLCQKLQEQRRGADQAAPSQPGFFSLLWYEINPGSAVGVAQLNADLRLEKSGNSHSANPVRTVIFEPGHHEPLEPSQKIQVDLLRASLKAYQSQYLAKLSLADTLSECTMLAEQLGLSPERIGLASSDLKSYLKLLDQQLIAQLHEELSVVTVRFPFVQAVPIEGYKEIQNFLDSQNRNDSFDLVLVLHGAPDGSLQDLKREFLPPSFLESLVGHSSIRNIVIYVCFPDRVVHFYDQAFQNLLVSGQKIYFGLSQGILADYDVMSIGLFHNFFAKYVQQIDGGFSRTPPD